MEPTATANAGQSDAPPKQRRGFAALTPERRREIAKLGGIHAHRLGVAHTWTSSEAKRAGSKGGKISRGGRGRLTSGEIAQMIARTEERRV